MKLRIAFAALLTLTCALAWSPAMLADETFFGGYRTTDQLFSDINALETAYPDLVEVVDYGDSFAKSVTGGISGPNGEVIAGDDLLAVRVTNQNVTGTKPVFVFMACLHAAEISTPELAMKWLDELVTSYGTDAEATWLVDHHEIWILPMPNPDGHRLVTLGTDHANGGIPWFWRKNANDADSCPWPTGNDFSDSNTFGVDLNRNFDFSWGTSNGRAGSSAVCDSYYRGTAAASEPETSALQTLFASLIADQRGPALTDTAPDTTSGIFVQLHNPFEIIGSPWGHTSAPAPNQTGLAAIGNKLSALSGYPYGQTHDILYQVTGGAEEWVYGELGAPAFIVELGEVSMPPLARVDDTFWPEMDPLLRYAAKIARTPYVLARGPEAVAVNVVDVGGNLEVQAQIDDGDNGAQVVTEAEAYIATPPWESGAVAMALTPDDAAFDSSLEAVSGTLDLTGVPNGRHLVYVRGRDAANDWGPVSATFIDIGPDVTAPARSNAAPTGVLVASTTQTQLTLSTDENATCRWDNTSGIAFASMAGAFDTTGATGHSTLLTGLVPGDVEVFVRCEDGSGNANATDLTVAFAVAAPGELTAGLVGYWPLDALTGTSAEDLSGQGYNGDLIGAPPWGSGMVNGGLALDGADDSIAFGRTPVLDELDEVTLSAWIRHSSATGWHSIIDKRDSQNDGFDLYLNSGSKLLMRTDTATLTSFATVADGAWHHIAGVYDGASISLYVDGALDRSSSANVGSISTTNGLRLGENWAIGNSFFAGDLDEVRIYDRALDAGEILDLYQYTGGPPAPDTTPPVRSNGAPSGTLAAGTTQTTISLSTDEAATCRYDTATGIDFDLMPTVFSTTGGTAHSTTFSGLTDGQPYAVYVRCQDSETNANPDDYAITFSVAVGGDITAGLIGYWPLDETAGTIVSDQSGGGYDGSIAAGSGWTTGQVNGALQLGGTDPFVSLPATPPLDSLSAVTVATWLKAPAATDWHSLIDKRDAVQDGFDIYLRPSSQLFLRVNDKTLTGTSVVADDTWHHVVGSYDGNRLAIYVDGVEEVSAVVGATALATGNPLRFGADRSGGFLLTGTLDEVRVWNRALTASEVTDVYNFTGGPPPPDTEPPTRSAGGPTGTLAAGTTQTTISLATNEDATCRYDTAAGTPYGQMPGAFSTTGGTAHSTTVSGLTNGNPYAYYVRCEDGELNSNTSDFAITFSVAAAGDLTAGLIGYWPMDETAGTTVGDQSGNGYNGAIAAGLGWTTGQVNGALELGGADPSVTVGAAPLLDNLAAVTMAAWLRAAPATDWHSLLDKRDGYTDGYDLYLIPSSRLFLRINDKTLTGTTVVADNTWHHVVGSYDGNRLTIYVDGVEDASAVVGATALNTSNGLRLGTGRSGGFFLSGSLDEVRLWDRALTSTEVTEAYNFTGGPPPPDTTAPVRSAGSPSGELPAGTTQAVLSLTTDEDATCRYDSAVGIDYQNMTPFSATGGTSHSTTVNGLVDGGDYEYQIRCQDGSGNANGTDYPITFSVASPGGPGNTGGLIGYWALEDGAGTVVSDTSGLGHDGQLNGGSWITGRVGGGLDLSFGDHAVVPATSDHNTLSAFSIAAWIRHSATTGSRAVVDKRDGVSDGYDLYINPQSTLLVRANEHTLEGTTVIADGAWHHVAGTWDGTRLTLYVDGQMEATKSVLPTAINVANDLFIGRNFASGFVFSGDLDEVRLYDAALSPAEVLALALPATATVTLPGWPEKFVVQRVGSAADLTLGGATTGTAAVEARVLDDSTGQPLAGLDWTVVDPAPVDGAWSGQLFAVPEGGWYRLEARLAGDPASARTGRRFGVGLVVAALGQSNMVKMFTEISFTGDSDLGTVTPATPNDLTRQYGYGDPRISDTNSGGYSRLTGGDYSWSDVTGVGGIRLANNLALELDIPVLLLDFSIDGSSILQWTDTAWADWQRFVLALGDAGGDVEAVLWHQGRADAAAGTPEATYRAALDTLKAQVEAEIPAARTLKFVTAVQNRGDYGGNVNSRYNAIRKAQIDWILATPEGYSAGNTIDADIALDSFGRGDGHFPASQYEIMADRCSRGILQAIDEPGFEGGVFGGEIASASLAGTVVTVQITQDQGTGLQLLDPVSDIEGFELSDDGWATVLRLGNGISTADLGAGNQTVELTLDSAPSGSLELRYLYGQNVFGHKATEQDRRANGNTLYDNYLYHPDRPGLPINGTVVPIAVTGGGQ